jgi:hypothetical protein
MKRDYCVYYSETKEQFTLAKIDRAKRFNLTIFVYDLTKSEAADKANELNRDLYKE